METTTSQNTHESGNRFNSTLTVVAYVIGGFAILGILGAIVTKLLIWLGVKMVMQPNEDNELDEVETGKAGRRQKESPASNSPDKRQDEVKPRAKAWEDELKGYRTMHPNRHIHIPSEDPISPRDISASPTSHGSSSPPTSHDTSGIDTSKLNPFKTNPSEIDTSKIDTSKAGPSKADPSKIDLSKIDISKIEVDITDGRQQSDPGAGPSVSGIRRLAGKSVTSVNI